MNNPAASKDGKWTVRLFYTAIALFLFGLAGAKLGLSPFASMLGVTFASLFAVIAAIIVLIGVIKNIGFKNVGTIGFAALALGALAFFNAGSRFAGGGGGAPIHDISTDTVNPPEFVVVATLRADNENPFEYLDDGTAEMQLEAYPDIGTIALQEEYDTAFARAFAAAEEMGWEVVANEPKEGRIEAVATTPFVGFKDDVVIRVQASDNGTLIDVRSKSRIGKGDMGVNAQRIRDYSAILKN